MVHFLLCATYTLLLFLLILTLRSFLSRFCGIFTSFKNWDFFLNRLNFFEFPCEFSSGTRKLLLFFFVKVFSFKVIFKLISFFLVCFFFIILLNIELILSMVIWRFKHAFSWVLLGIHLLWWRPNRFTLVRQLSISFNFNTFIGNRGQSSLRSIKPDIFSFFMYFNRISIPKWDKARTVSARFHTLITRHFI